MEISEAYRAERPLLFLDVDGVLNGHEWIHLASGPRIMPAPANCFRAFIQRCAVTPQIVLSTTWAAKVPKRWSYEGFADALETHGIPEIDIVGKTTKTNSALARSAAILEAVQTWKPLHWAAIDDLPLECGHFVRTDPAKGMEPHHVTKLIETLATPVYWGS